MVLRSSLALLAFLPVAFASESNTWTFTHVYSFTNQNPQLFPNGVGNIALILSIDGTFYGTTKYGGTNGMGTVFRLTTAGDFAVIHSFLGGSDGSNPYGPLAQDKLGNIYGTTIANTAWVVKAPFLFTSFGYLPGGTQLQNGAPTGLAYGPVDGNLYGWNGTGVFRLTPAGVATTIGAVNYATNIVQGTNGVLYCVNGGGAVQTVTPSGTVATFYSTDQFLGPLVLGTDGNLYVEFSYGIFQVTPGGIGKNSGVLGEWDQGAPMIQASDQNLYIPGDVGSQAFYQMNTDFVNTGYIFVNSSDLRSSDVPTQWNALVEGPDGMLYGAAIDDGTGTNTGYILKITLTKGSTSNSGGSGGGSSGDSAVDVSSGTEAPDDGSQGDYGVPEAMGDPDDLAGSASCGDPVCISSGNVYETFVNYQTSGPNPLGFTRYYNSLGAANTYATFMGTGWRCTYDRYLQVTLGSVIAERADGEQVPFTFNGTSWVSDGDMDYTLTNSGSTWTLTDPKDNVETYGWAGPGLALLGSIQARNGYTLTVIHAGTNEVSEVHDSLNRMLVFGYTNGQLAGVITSDGLTIRYGYTNNELTSVTYQEQPLGQLAPSPTTHQTYVYENPALPSSLTGIIDENGNRYATWTYDSFGRAITSQFGTGASLTTFAYNPDGSRTVTNALGEQEIYKFTTVLGVSKMTEIDRVAATSLPAASRKFTYDANGYMASQTDWNGNLSTYVNDIHGQPTTINEAVGTPQARTTNITYHQTFHLPVQVVGPGLTTTYTYDANGELLTKTLTDTTTTTAPYSTNGQTRTWIYTWSNFKMASIQAPRTDVTEVTQYTYGPGGNTLTATTNALGQTTQIMKSLPGGLPLVSVNPNGVTTTRTYDSRLHLLTSTVSTAAGPFTTRHTYDAAEQLLTTTKPDGSAITNTYDSAHRLTGYSDLFNNSVSYTLDAMGDQTQSVTSDPYGNVQRSHSVVFDTLGRLIQDMGGAGQTTTYTYDSNGNALTITDPLGRVTKRTYDALNHLVSVTDANGGVATTTYDAHGRPLTITDPNGGVTSYTYNGFGDLIQRVSPDTGTTVFYFDGDGNMTQQIDGRGAVTNYTYDAIDRKIAVTYPADPAENVTYTYDQGNLGIGRLTTVADADGSLSRTYDERGNLLTDLRSNGAVNLQSNYSYDAASRLASVAYPSGWTATYTRDMMGRVTSVTAQPAEGTASPVLTNVAYQPFGPVSGLAFGNGVTETRSFDQDMRVIGVNDIGNNALQFLTYAYDANDNVSSIGNSVAPANGQVFQYDNLNRITSAKGGYGSYTYTYDAAGNRLTQNGMGFSYAAHSNKLSGVTAAGASQSIGYDAAGHITSFGSGSVTAATYNQAGELAIALSGTNMLAQYTYDAFGERVARVGSVTATTYFQYDQGSHLLEETDGEGNPQVDYIYLGSVPIATISPSAGQIYFIHNDRLGTPQAASDAGQNVVWTANYGPFGEMSTVPSLIVQNLRLPGQEFDANTGFYHNGFRDYAPAWGRYLESDPLGLNGGINTYGYAQANPVKFTDSAGLSILTDVATIAGGYGFEKMLETTISPYVGEKWAPILVGGTLQVVTALPMAATDLELCLGACKYEIGAALVLEFGWGALSATADDNIVHNTWGLTNTIMSYLTGDQQQSAPAVPIAGWPVTSDYAGTVPPGDGLTPPPTGNLPAAGAGAGPGNDPDLSAFGLGASATPVSSGPCSTVQLSQ